MGVGRETGARVQVSPTPPNKETHLLVCFFVFDIIVERLEKFGCGSVALPPSKSLLLRQKRNSRLIQSYRPAVFFLSLKVNRKSLIYKGFFAFVVLFYR